MHQHSNRIHRKAFLVLVNMRFGWRLRPRYRLRTKKGVERVRWCRALLFPGEEDHELPSAFRIYYEPEDDASEPGDDARGSREQAEPADGGEEVHVAGCGAPGVSCWRGANSRNIAVQRCVAVRDRAVGSQPASFGHHNAKKARFGHHNAKATLAAQEKAKQKPGFRKTVGGVLVAARLAVAESRRVAARRVHAASGAGQASDEMLLLSLIPGSLKNAFWDASMDQFQNNTRTTGLVYFG